MGKYIVTYNEIGDINHSLEDKGLNFKVHLHDACGSQSFTIDAMPEYNEEQLEAMKQVVAEYFQVKDIAIKFIEDGLEFVMIS